MKVEKEIIEYVNKDILPQYRQLDKGHNIEHIEYVIKRGLILAEKYMADSNMVYAIAAYHDIGMLEKRDNHEMIGAEILGKDEMINRFFTKKQIEIMKKAIREHRASFKGEYSSIYSKIVSQADRNFDINLMTCRAILYGKREYPEYNFEQHYKRTYNYLVKKYGDYGYVHMILDFEMDETKLDKIKEILRTESLFRKIFTNCYRKLDED